MIRVVCYDRSGLADVGAKVSVVISRVDISVFLHLTGRSLYCRSRARHKATDRVTQ